MGEMEDRITKLFEDKFNQLSERLESVTALKQQIADLDLKISDQADCVEQVQTKVDLAMKSLGQVQQEQLHVARTLKGSAPPRLIIPNRSEPGLMGAHLQFPPPPPLLFPPPPPP